VQHTFFFQKEKRVRKRNTNQMKEGGL